MDENENNKLNEELANEEENVVENNIEENVIENDSLENETENSETENNEESLTEKKKGNKILPLIAVILAGIVVVTVSVLAILTFTSPKNTFFRLVNGSFSGMSKIMSKVDESVWGDIYKINTSSKLTLDADITGTIESENDLVNEWVNNFKNFELTAHEDIDFNSNYRNTIAKFVLNGEDFMSGKLVQNENLISINIDNVTEGFVTVDNENLEKLWDKIGYEGPDMLNDSSSILKNFKYSKGDILDLKGLFSKFAIGFSKAFDDEDFAYGKGTVEYDEGTIDCKTMDMIVNNMDLNNGVISALEEVNGDTRYKNVLYKLVCTINILSAYKPRTKEEFDIALDDLIEQIKGLEVSTSEESGFIIRLYYKGKDIVKVDMLSRDYNTKLLSFTAITNENSSYYKLTQDIVVYEDKVTTIDKVTTHNISINYIDYETNEIVKGFGSEIVIKIDNTNDDEGTVTLIEKVEMASNLEESLDSEPVVVKDYTIKFDSSGNDKKLDITLKDGDTSYSSIFVLKAAIKEMAQFEKVSLKAEEVFDTTKKSDEELIAKKDKIVENWNNNIANDETRTSQFQVARTLYLNNSILNSFIGY